MFRKISITRDTTLDYLLYTSCTSDIAGYLDNLRELVVANRRYREDHLAYRLAVLFPHLPSTVRRLEMYNTSWSYTPPALVFFTLFHSLNTLILVNCKFVSFSAFRQIIHALPIVSDLVLRCVKWESCDSDAPTDSQLRLTECLLCQVENLDIVLRWLYNSSSLHSLRVFDAPTTSAVWEAIDLSADELDLAGESSPATSILRTNSLIINPRHLTISPRLKIDLRYIHPYRFGQKKPIQHGGARISACDG